MRILFLNPPFKNAHGKFSREQRSPAITKGGTFYYPMWLCYAAGVLEEAGFEVSLIDAPASRMPEEEVFERAVRTSPDIIVVDTSTPSISSDVIVAERLKELTGAFLVLVGTHPSALPEKTFAMGAHFDAILRKEYEYTIRELAEKYKGAMGRVDRHLLESIKGLTFRWEGEVFHNPDRPAIENLDAIPFLSRVYKRHLNIEDYFYTICRHPVVAIYSGRGCPHSCVYCVYPQVMHGHRYRKRSVENLIEEFKYIERELPKVKEIFIEDDTFTVDRARVRAFSEAYRRAGLRISWVANSRADVDYETLLALKRCRCRLLCVGLESGAQEVLDAMKKRLKVERARRFVSDARRANILIHGCFMVGNPSETKDTLEKTLEYAKSLALDTAQFFPIMVYPGTDAYDWTLSNSYLITEDYSKWNTEEGLHNCLVTRPGLSNVELVEFCDRARREFYMRPAYIMYRFWSLLRHPAGDGPRMMKSMKVFKKFLFRGTYGKRGSRVDC